MQRRIELDAWYVAHQSLWLDLVILARTPLEVLRRRNAV
jgi:lipopolysaccharide/colanic/teichoic acid biosynthesis glycosyltransferase